MRTYAAALFAAAAQAKMSQLDFDFMHWIGKFNKKYDSIEEYEARLINFARNDEFIKEANSRRGRSYKAGHNKFSDFHDEEYEAMLGLKQVNMPEIDLTINEVDISNLPESFDWRDEGMVTAVKDQGSCGSCWAFSATEAVESAWMINGGDETIMAPQQLVDCSWAEGNNGCNGGWYFWAYDYLKGAKLQTESSYPYTARDGTCSYDESDGVTNVSSYGQTRGTSDNLARLAQQPVNVAVAAGNNVFRNYSSGVITEDDGCPKAIDHAIVAVGWGVENGTQYYIVRNSWGEGWGLDGYVQIATSDGYFGVCGINSYVYYPTL